MSIRRAFNRFSKKHSVAILNVGIASSLITGSLAMTGFFNPFVAVAIGLQGVSLVIDLVVSNINSEWDNEAGQRFSSDIVIRDLIKDRESLLRDDLVGYKIARTDKERQKAIESFQYHLEEIDLYLDEVKISSSNDVSKEYCFGYEEITKPLAIEYLESNILEMSNVETEKAPVISLRKKSGKFGL